MQLFQKRLSQANLIKKVASFHAILGQKTTQKRPKTNKNDHFLTYF